MDFCILPVLADRATIMCGDGYVCGMGGIVALGTREGWKGCGGRNGILRSFGDRRVEKLSRPTFAG